MILFYRALAVLQKLYIISCCDYASYFRSSKVSAKRRVIFAKVIVTVMKKKVSLVFDMISLRGSSLAPVTHSLAF